MANHPGPRARHRCARARGLALRRQHVGAHDSLGKLPGCCRAAGADRGRDVRPRLSEPAYRPGPAATELYRRAETRDRRYADRRPGQRSLHRGSRALPRGAEQRAASRRWPRCSPEPDPGAPDAAHTITPPLAARAAPAIVPETKFRNEDDSLDSFMQDMVNGRAGSQDRANPAPAGRPDANAAPLGTSRLIAQAAAYPPRSQVVVLAMPPDPASLPPPRPAPPLASTEAQELASLGAQYKSLPPPPPEAPSLAEPAAGAVWGMPDMAAGPADGPLAMLADAVADAGLPRDSALPPAETTLAERAPGVVWGMPDMAPAPAATPTEIAVVDTAPRDRLDGRNISGSSGASTDRAALGRPGAGSRLGHTRQGPERQPPRRRPKLRRSTLHRAWPVVRPAWSGASPTWRRPRQEWWPAKRQRLRLRRPHRASPCRRCPPPPNQRDRRPQ